MATSSDEHLHLHRATRLHALALALLPQAAPDYRTVLAKSKNLYIVLERADHPCNLDLPDPDSFLWIKGTKKLDVRRLIGVYRQRAADQGEIQLKMGGMGVLHENFIIGDLPEIKDQLVVLSAAVKREAAPANPNSSFSSATSSQSSARTPLQLVNRQLQTPTQRSTDELTARPEFKGITASPTVQPLSHAVPSAVTTPVAPNSVNQGVAPAPAGPNGESPAEEDWNVQDTQYEPRDQGNPFAEKHDLGEPELLVRGTPLSDLIKDDTPERLEAGVETGLQLLSTLEAHMKELGSSVDAQNWLEQINKTRQEAVNSRAVIGVVGNTGAGKSSVINAMLDEERLVPTNCMRACTAVVTELSWNYSDNPAAKYRAEIEFIRLEDWEKELKVLFQELFDDSGNFNREISNADSEAGIAYSKVRAVYNTYTRDQLATASVDSLLGNKKIRSLLGTTKKVIARESGSFYNQLQQWVDSKEKGTEKLDKNGNRIGLKIRDFEAWPLIKVVKIYTKSPALSTGACIVDLPGVHDSNAARAAVAQGYMKQCTGLWIVAPINRAVDDKAAKVLLGDSFKRQMKFDGTYSAVTFICSKTDDISLTEAEDSLGLADRVADLNDRATELERQRRQLEHKMEDAKLKQEDYDATVEQIDDETEEWEKLLDDLDAGKVVYPPSKSAKKRKAASSSSKGNKRQRRMRDSDDDDDTDAKEQEEDRPAESEPTPQHEGPKEPLTQAQIEEKLDELKKMKKEARREKRALSGRVEEIKNSIDTIEIELAENAAQESAICIAGRNEYSRGRIKQDFAAGIRELDQETAEEDDPENFDPDNEARDYDEVAASLPVFCVSSRAYQKLSGRLRRDNDVPGYTDVDQTEIPQLQAHCKQLTIKGRQASCRIFLNKLRVLFNSVGIWASDDGSGVKLSLQQRDVEKAWIARKLKELERALEKAVTDCLDDAVDTLKEQLFEKFIQAVQTASQTALLQAQSWGAKRNEGGLHHGTYQATIRREGVFRRDFNAELTEPMYKVLGSVWERVFMRRLPNILRSLKRSASNVLKHFHIAAEARARASGRGLGRIQLDGYSVYFDQLCEQAVATLNEKQREVNREFTPAITEAMRPAYERCQQEKGTGMFARMKGHMAQHVSNEQDVMFKTASEHVQASLLNLVKTIRTNMLDKADQVFVAMSRDYTENNAVIKLTREERAVRRTIDGFIGSADTDFRHVLERDLEELKSMKMSTGSRHAPEEVDHGEDSMDIDDVEEDGGEQKSVQKQEADNDELASLDGPSNGNETINPEQAGSQKEGNNAFPMAEQAPFPTEQQSAPVGGGPAVAADQVR